MDTNEDESVTVPVIITDKEGGNAKITVESLTTSRIPNDDTHILINGYPSGYFLSMNPYYQQTSFNLTLTPVKDVFGTAEMKITVTDGKYEVTRNFAVNIKQVNDAPVITGEITNKQTKQDVAVKDIQVTVSDLEGGYITVSVNADSTGLDTDGNENLITSKGIDLDGFGSSRTVWVEAGKSSNLSLSLTPETGENGRTKIIITADDGTDESQKSFLLLVDSVNTAPVISEIGNWNLEEDKSVEIPFSLSDTEGGTMKVSVTSSNTKLIPNDSSHIIISDFANYYLAEVPGNGSPVNLTLLLIPTADETGMAEITVKVEDGEVSPPTKIFYVNVTPVNDAPVISGIPNQSTSDDTPKDVSFIVSDKEGGSVTVSVHSLGDDSLVPDNDYNINLDGFGRERTATLPSSQFKLTLTPASGVYGRAEIEITVKDGDQTAAPGSFL